LGQVNVRTLKIHTLRNGIATLGNVGSEYSNSARAGPDQTKEHCDSCCLAGPVSSEQSHRGPGLKSEVEMIDGRDRTKALRQTAHDNRGHALCRESTFVL
jgi:hypothetical protein